MARTRAFLATIFAKDIVAIIDCFFDRNPSNQVYTARYGYYEDCLSLRNYYYGIRGACDGNNIEILKLFVRRVTDVELSEDSFKAIRAAYRNGCPEIISLVESVIELNWDAALEGACDGGHYKLAKFAIYNGTTAWDRGLYYAYRGGHHELIDLMIAHGANRRYALNGAAKGGHLKLVTDLLQINVGWDLDDALRRACQRGHTEIAKLLIGRGANIGEMSCSYIAYGKSMELVLLSESTPDNYLKYGIMYKWPELIDYAITIGATNFSEGLTLSCEINLINVASRMISLGARNFKRAHRNALDNNNYELAEFMLKKCRDAYENGDYHQVDDSNDNDDDDYID
jgi:hypothetical protein